MWRSIINNCPGYNYILVLVDICTRFVFLRLLKQKDMHSVASELLNIFLDVGFPKILQSDNGTEFVNQIISTICQTASIDSRLISAYHPRANGIAERFVQTIGQTILKTLNGRLDNWETMVRPVQYFTNGKVAALHDSTPFSLLFARPMNAFEDYRNNVSKQLNTEQLLARVQYLNELVYPAINQKAKRKQTQDTETFNKKYKNRLYDDAHFTPGSWVMAKNELRSDKVSPRYDGPFEVLRRNRGGSYLLRGSDDTVYHRPACSLKLVTRTPITTLPSNHFEVESILNHRPKTPQPQNNSEYFVKWKGHDISQSSWVPTKDFDGPAIITAYFKQLKKGPAALTKD
jgi:hypothetical protein